MADFARVWLNQWMADQATDPRNWCTRCHEYAADGMLCPVCLDKDRLKLTPASMCRG